MLSFFMFQFQERTVLSHMLLSKNRGKKVHFVKVLLLRSILWCSWDICGNLHFLNYFTYSFLLILCYMKLLFEAEERLLFW